MSIYSSIDYNQYFDNPMAGNINLEYLELGNIHLPTGNIIACDPFVCLWNTKPYTKTVLPGNYPVVACIARTEESGDRYALVKLEFSKSRAVKWEMAIIDGQDTSELEDGWFFGYPVDAGFGCFCDTETQEWYDKWSQKFMEENPHANIFIDFLAAEFKKNAIDENNPNDIGDWLNFYLPNRPDLNVIMFLSGYGDGRYPCYWGITDDENICSLVVDFMVLQD